MTSTNGQHSQPSQQHQQPEYNIATASSPTSTAAAAAAASAPNSNTSPTTATGIVDSTSSRTTATAGATVTVTSETVIGSQPTSTTLVSDPSNAFHHRNQEFRQVCFNPSIVATSGLTAATSRNAAATSTTTNNTSSIKRNSPSSNDSSKRIRLDTTNTNTNTNANPILTSTKPPKFVRKYRSRSLPIISFNNSSAFYPHYRQKKHHHHHHHHNQDQHQNIFNTNSTIASSHSSVNNTSFISNTAVSSSSSSSSNTIPSLPPINLQSLKEIDLHEILKNPQLRHDILFDPQLQFRPNLDGERGKRKKSIIDKYWLEVRKECQGFFNQKVKPEEIKIHRLPILFTTLRDILLSLLPTKDRQQVSEIMDIELLVQQLKHGSFDFVEMSQWLGDVFKLHCAPMRDQWVVEMIEKFVDAYNYNNVSYLVNGLRMIFQILEAMKLDVANHQIRILRPVLIETAVDFERDYFQTLINHSKINIHDSLNWFYKNFVKKFDSIQQSSTAGGGGGGTNPAKRLSTLHQDAINNTNLKPIIISSVIDLLSCRQMASEFPSTLAFDHTRLVLLRADARQLVCIQLCVVLYKQLVINAKVSTNLLSPNNIAKVQQEILAIVTDDSGNIKWTKNISAISLQLVKNLYPNESKINVSDPSIKSLVQFSHSWLLKHMQPNSQVYGLMEIKVFKELLTEISVLVENDDLISDTSNITTTTTTSTAAGAAATASIANTTTTTTTTTTNNELKNIATRIATLVKFHWNVFGGYYIDYLKSQRSKLQQEQDNSTILPTMMEDGDDNNNVSSKKKNDDDKTNNTNPTSHRGGENNSNIDNTTSAPLSMLS